MLVTDLFMKRNSMPPKPGDVRSQGTAEEVKETQYNQSSRMRGLAGEGGKPFCAVRV